MLHLVGLGLDDGEVTEKGIEAIKGSEKIFAEFYTNTETVDIAALEEKTGKSIEKLSRKEVEQKDQIIESAKERDTVFLVSGDPLTATTHYDIKHRAEQKGIDVEVVHAPSIFTSVAETGLNVYKFGRTVTLPEHASPESIIDHVEKNDSVGLHTLVLLDINYDAGDAAEKLIDMSPELKNREAVILERANAQDQNIVHGELGDLSPEGETPHCIVLVGEKSHKEEENLEAY
ncbi:diphthine synthase [Candidatus Nanosalina sp. VS9-1]|uniref:diphthine synthase n=1 Tax=Candidatus Nanosalina sp. VS9-1 TaxID=3388566 RepID=UPI0039E066BD